MLRNRTLALATALAACSLWTPANAQTAPAPAAAPAAAAAAANPSGNVPNGIPEGAARLQSQNSTGFPAPNTVEGQPIESRAPELPTDHPVVADETRAPYHKTPPYKVTIVTDQLKTPWSIAFLPDGKMLVTEKIAGTLRLVDAGGTLSEPFKGVPAVVGMGQMGLLDLALDPAYASNHRLFFSFAESTHQTGSPIENSRIVIARATVDEAGLALNNVQVIFRAGPSLPRAMAANSGGRLAIAKDGTIFATIGDRSGSPPWDVAQQLDTDLGKIVHITVDGAPARNNPFLNKTGALPEIWSIGHRSEEGLAIDPVTGALWEDENGPRGGDKLLHPESGKNYGWPLYNHGLDYPGTPIGTGDVTAPGTEQPVYYWDPVIAPSGLAFYRGNLFPAWKNSVFVGGLRGELLDRLELRDGKVVAEEPLLVDLKERIRDVRVTADGTVFVLTDNRDGHGKLLKLTPG